MFDMASDHERIHYSSSTQEYEFDDEIEMDDRDLQLHPHPLTSNSIVSRLSVCTTNSSYDEDGHGCLDLFISKLSLEDCGGSDADDEEFSDEKEIISSRYRLCSSDSDEEPPAGCRSLPATPPRAGRSGRGMSSTGISGVKNYVSENEAQRKAGMRKKRRGTMARRQTKKHDMSESMELGRHVGCEGGVGSGEECGGGLVVITRPKGGSRAMRMDLEEVKACRDLGFDMEMSSSNLSIYTSSGANSPISNWRISSPGDDPRDVKARLKVWAQAVALASTSTCRVGPVI